MASMHSSCFRALKWLHFLRSKPLAASTASFASSPASYSAWMQHCVITAVQERGQRGEQPERRSTTVLLSVLGLTAPCRTSCKRAMMSIFWVTQDRTNSASAA